MRARPAALAAMNNLKSPLAVLVSVLFWGASAGMAPRDWLFLAAGTALIIGAATSARKTAED